MYPFGFLLNATYLSFVSGKAHLSLSSQWPNIIRRSTLRSVWECVFAWCLRLRNLVFGGKDLCNLPPPTKNSPYFRPVFLYHALLHACASNLFYALLRNLPFKLQVYGNYHWDWGPWSHQVAKVRLAIPQGLSPLNPIETLTDVCVALCCTLDVTAKILLHRCVQRKGLHNTWKLEAWASCVLRNSSGCAEGGCCMCCCAGWMGWVHCRRATTAGVDLGYRTSSCTISFVPSSACIKIKAYSWEQR